MTRVVRSCAVLAIMLLSACAASVLTPQAAPGDRHLRLERLVPRQFGAWAEESNAALQVNLSLPGTNDPALAERASYDDVLMRTYRREDGRRVMVAIAYGRTQTQEIKMHRPELCYYAQGFKVRPLGARGVRLSPAHTVDSLALLTRNRSRIEVVTYWIRIGERITHDAWQTRWTIFRAGLAGRIPDGLMVRASSLAASELEVERELALQHAFLADLYREVPASTQRLLAGA